jgi:dephospho-CoA kinase
MRVGLTGGIASGKTTVARLFAARGVTVIDTDEIARDVVAPGSAVLARVVEAFGPEVLNPEGTLDRPRMRELVFADPERRAQLEAILHPAILEEMERRSASAPGPYHVLVVPLLIESDLVLRVDRVLVVDVSEATQLKRLLARDAESPSQALAILAAQVTPAERLARAHDVISNEGSLESLAAQVDELHVRYLALAQQARPKPPR